MTSCRWRMAPLPFHVRRPRFEPRHVVLVQLQLGRVLDRDDAFRVADVARQHVEQRRLAGAGAAADQAVQPGPDAVRQEVEHRPRQRLERHEIVGLEAFSRKTANRQQRAVHGERRDDGVDARTVLQAGVHHRRAVVHAPADAADDAVDDAHQVLVVLERRGHALDAAAALHEHVLVRVDEDVADSRVAQQRLERTEAEDVVDELAEQPFTLAEADRDVLFAQQLAEERTDFALRPAPVGLGQRLEVQPVEQLAMNVRLQLGVLARHGGRRAPDLAAADGAAGWGWRRLWLMVVYQSDAMRSRPSLAALSLAPAPRCRRPD